MMPIADINTVSWVTKVMRNFEQESFTEKLASN